MFLVKKIISRFFYPVPLGVEFLLAGLILLWFTRKQRAGKLVVSVGTAVLLLLSNPSFSRFLLGPLERQYPPFASSASGLPDSVPDAAFVVVLAGAFTSDPHLPPTSQLGEDTMLRLIEGIRIHRTQPGSKLLLSGGGVFDPVPTAEIMGQVARSLGVDADDIVLEVQSRDTGEQARLISSKVGTSPLVLVTSAAHMPRAMGLFRRLGMRPIAAPTHYLAKEGQGTSPDDFFPSAWSLHRSTRAIHEYLGLLWEIVRNVM